MTSTPTVLLIEDDDDVRDVVAPLLDRSGFEVIAPTLINTEANVFCSQALELAKKHDVDFAVCDLTLPNDDSTLTVTAGLGLVREIKNLRQGTRIVILSSSVTEDALKTFKALGASAALSKTQVDLKRLPATLWDLYKQPRRRKPTEPTW